MANSKYKIKTVVLRPILDLSEAEQIVENGKNGFLFPVEQIDELVERIERFIKNPETILSHNCVQSVKQFDVLEKVKQIYSVYSNMVSV